MCPAHVRYGGSLPTPDILFLFAFKMEPIDGAAVPLPESVPGATQPCREGDQVRQYAHFQHALPIGSTPIQTRAYFQPCLANDLSRNSHLIFASYSSDHGNNIRLEITIVKGL